MISLSKSIPVNPPGASSKISRAEVWHGLTLKADNALPFVPAMTYCKVLERENANTFVREIEFKGERMKERVTLDPGKSVTFERISGSVLGTIKNYIDVSDKGDISLRFTFELTLEGTPAGSDKEKEYAKSMESAYLGAVDATLGAIRKLHEETRKKTPDWMAQYYADVDAQKMDAFLAHHLPDARLIFGNNPAAVGHDQIKGGIGQLWSSIHSLSHRVINVWNDDKHHVLEAAVTYVRKDGKEVILPCVSIFERRDDKVAELRIHMDLGPVFAP